MKQSRTVAKSEALFIILQAIDERAEIILSKKGFDRPKEQGVRDAINWFTIIFQEWIRLKYGHRKSPV